VILFESAGLGRSTGEVPKTIPEMAAHLLAFADALGLTQVDLLGFSLGGMVAQQAALERPSFIRKMLLVGTAPEGGDDIMHVEKPVLKQVLEDPNLKGLQVLVKLFFAPTELSQAAGQAFVARLAARKEDREPIRPPPHPPGFQGGPGGAFRPSDAYARGPIRPNRCSIKVMAAWAKAQPPSRPSMSALQAPRGS